MLNEGGGSISSHLTNISFMEHVVLKVTLDISFGDDDPNYSYDKYYNYDEDVVSHKYARRGDIRITLESPQGTESELLPYRDHDFVNTKGYSNWEFMSVHFWGENPIGNWKLRISYKSTIGVVTISNMSVTFFGTEAVPTSVSSTQSHCSEECDYKCSYDSGLEICDICKSKRDSETLKCLTVCPEDYDEISNYCIKSNSTYFYNSSTNVQIVDISPSMTADDILQSTSRVYNDFSNQHQSSAVSSLFGTSDSSSYQPTHIPSSDKLDEDKHKTIISASTTTQSIQELFIFSCLMVVLLIH